MKGLRVLALVIFVAAPAEAATLPLRPGTFVMIGEPCADAPLATLFHYDGRSFSYPHATQCRFQILSHGAQDAKLRETCYALGDGTPATAARLSVSLPVANNRQRAGAPSRGAPRAADPA